MHACYVKALPEVLETDINKIGYLYITGPYSGEAVKHMSSCIWVDNHHAVPNLVGQAGLQNKVPTDRRREGTRLRTINKSEKSKLHGRKGTEVLDQ